LLCFGSIGDEKLLVKFVASMEDVATIVSNKNRYDTSNVLLLSCLLLDSIILLSPSSGELIAVDCKYLISRAKHLWPRLVMCAVRVVFRNNSTLFIVFFGYQFMNDDCFYGRI
jgi:hypothetical protein